MQFFFVFFFLLLHLLFHILSIYDCNLWFCGSTRKKKLQHFIFDCFFASHTFQYISLDKFSVIFCWCCFVFLLSLELSKMCEMDCIFAVQCTTHTHKESWYCDSLLTFTQESTLIHISLSKMIDIRRFLFVVALPKTNFFLYVFGTNRTNWQFSEKKSFRVM